MFSIMSHYTKDSTATEVASQLVIHINGNVVLITGASPGGLGATAALAIAPHSPALIILTGRTLSLLDQAKKPIQEQTPNTDIRLSIFDLASMIFVREAGVKVNKYPESTDVLFNNVGIMAHPCCKMLDGFEIQFAINHLAHFLFTSLILGRVLRGERILNVTSAAYEMGGMHFDGPNFNVSEFPPQRGWY